MCLNRYSKITLERSSLKEAIGHIPPNNIFLTFLTFQLVSYTPSGFQVVKQVFEDVLWKSMIKKLKIHEKVVTYFLEFIGFIMVFRKPFQSHD